MKSISAAKEGGLFLRLPNHIRGSSINACASAAAVLLGVGTVVFVLAL